MVEVTPPVRPGWLSHQVTRLEPFGLHGLVQCLDISTAERLRAEALDDLEEERPPRVRRTGEDLEQLARMVGVHEDVEIAQLLGDLPTVFLGHSMGASVAYETVRRMPWKPELLVVSARRAPSVDRPGDLHLMNDAELLARLEKLGGFHLEALSEPELRDLFMPGLRADYHLIETYRPEQGVRIDVAVLAVVGDRDPEVCVADVQAWQHATAADFTLEVLAGDHFYLNQHAHTLISTTLRRYQPG
jgi:surfactin synthase thioesterase subunit